MNDYISRQAAIDWLRNDWDGLVSTVFFGIENIPTADVVPIDYHERCLSVEIQKRKNMVEVVRCKDCTHWREGTAFSYCDKLYGMGVLDALDYMVAEDDYCSFGERADA